MKKIISILLAVLTLTALATGFQVSAYEKYITSGDWEYYVLADGTARISSYYGTKTEVTIPTKIDGKKVTSIGDEYDQFYVSDAFVKTLNIPESVTNIAEGCLSFFHYLENINVDANNPNYSSSNGILYSKGKWTLYAYPMERTDKSYTISSVVKRIGKRAFDSAHSLESVTIPNSVTEIREKAFSGSGLLSVTIPASVEKLGEDAFGCCYSLEKVILEDGFKRLDYNSFFASSITSLNIPASVQYIAEGAICNLPSLHNITVDSANKNYCAYSSNLCSKDKSILLFRPTGKTPTSVTLGAPYKRIGKYALCGTDSLQEVIVSEGVLEIGDSAFENCGNLTKATLPDSINKIGKKAFKDTKIKWIHLSDSITKIEEETFYNCTQLQSVKIPASATEIGRYAFCNCKSISTVKLSKNVKTISYRAFLCCGKLTEITLPDSLEYVGEGAFRETGIKSVTIPPSVKAIDSYAFGFNSSNTPISGFVISGKNGTQAQKYADYYEMKFESTGNIFGDVNSDGVVNIQDATAIQRYIAGLAKLNNYEKTAADLDGNGTITVSDATKLQKTIVGIN